MSGRCAAGLWERSLQKPIPSKFILLLTYQIDGRELRIGERRIRLVRPTAGLEMIAAMCVIYIYPRVTIIDDWKGRKKI